MNNNKLLIKLFVAASLLALFFCAGCASKNEIQSVDGQALIEQGNAYMTCLQVGDLESAQKLMSPYTQRELEKALRIAGSMVNLDSMYKMYGPKIVEWAFDQAQFSTRAGVAIGSLKGNVEFINGERGNVLLEFEKDGATWKVRSSSLDE